MHAEVVARLRCPVCRESLRMPDGAHAALRCHLGHSFDQARQGYVQLTARPLVHTGDTPSMVAARSDFLAHGHYDPISDALGDVAREQMGPSGLLVDAGAGTGYQTARVLSAVPDAFGVALDASKACARVAARANARLDALVCDIWQPLPIADGSADVVLNVFAPRSGAEFARVLRPGGVLAVVSPQPAHLRELIAPLSLLRVDPAKPARIAAELSEWFTTSEVIQLDWSMSLSHVEIGALVGMGPSAWHSDPTTLALAIADLPEPMTVTAAVAIGTYAVR